MERLTNDGYCMCLDCIDVDICGYIRGHDPACPKKREYDRLAAYERTGLEPDEIIELKGRMEGLDK